MRDTLKALAALAIGVGFCAWAGWFRVGDWRAWVALAVVTAVVSALTWVFKQYDGSNVKW
jgi:hypothetical protein